MKTMAPSLMWKVCWISGASTKTAASSSSASKTMAVRMKNIHQPPMRSPSRRVIGSALTPGRRSSGKTISARASSWAACRAASPVSTAPANPAAEPSSPPAFGATGPPCRSL